MIKFLCGCTAEISDGMKKDPEGFVVCPTHGLRRYGWRSLPRVSNGRPDFSLSSLTPLEVEHRILEQETRKLVEIPKV